MLAFFQEMERYHVLQENFSYVDYPLHGFMTEDQKADLPPGFVLYIPDRFQLQFRAVLGKYEGLTAFMEGGVITAVRTNVRRFNPLWMNSAISDITMFIMAPEVISALKEEYVQERFGMSSAQIQNLEEIVEVQVKKDIAIDKPEHVEKPVRTDEGKEEDEEKLPFLEINLAEFGLCIPRETTADPEFRKIVEAVSVECVRDNETMAVASWTLKNTTRYEAMDLIKSFAVPINIRDKPAKLFAEVKKYLKSL